MDLRGIGKGLVGFAGALRDVHLLSTKQIAEQVHAVRASAAHIEDLAGHIIAFTCRYTSIGHIAYEGEVACLFAISHDREWFARELLRKEHTEHCSVRATCTRAWTIHVEEAHARDVHLVDTRPIHRVLFSQVLRDRIGILATDRRGLWRRVHIRDPIAT